VELRGGSVVLEPLRLEHVGGLVAAASGDRSTYGFTEVPDGEAAMATYVEDLVADQAEGFALPFAIRLAVTGPVVGSTRLFDLASWPHPATRRGGVAPGATPDVAEIGGTWLAASVQRSSVNTTCKRLLLGHAFDTWGVERVCLQTDSRNERSRAAIERIGARFEGIRRAHKRATDGTARDSAFFSILRSEWPEVRARLDERLAR
jgi:RimJ/RimL family protein N-acetyltransferase